MLGHIALLLIVFAAFEFLDRTVLGIAFLPDIRLEIAAVKLFYVRLYGYVIQKPAAFRHKL